MEMSSIGIIKRIVPFLVTLTVGLFVASFFVDLAPRPTAFPDGRRRRCREFQNLYMQERDRADRLQRENDRMKQNPINLRHSEPWTAPNDFVPPPPLKAPRANR
jgi:hypothetical protein